MLMLFYMSHISSSVTSSWWMLSRAAVWSAFSHLLHKGLVRGVQDLDDQIEYFKNMLCDIVSIAIR